MIRHALAALGSAAALFVMLELTARIYLFGWAGLDPRRIESLRDFRATEFVRESENAALGFEHVPNVSGFFKLVPYETNSAGMRDREYPVEKPEGAFRVVVLGSSFTVPVGVRIEDAFHSLMEEQLSTEYAPIRYEFLNFAIGAHHPRQTLAMLRDRALHYDPDLILFGVTPLSMPLLTASVAPPPGVPRATIRPATHPFWDSFLYALIAQRTGIVDPEIDSGPSPNGPPGSRIVDALGEISRSEDVPIAVLRLEIDAQRRAEGEAEVIAAVQDAGLHFLDTRESFAGQDPRDLWIHALDPHPDAAAHQTFARTVTEFLKSRGLLTPRER